MDSTNRKLCILKLERLRFIISIEYTLNNILYNCVKDIIYYDLRRLYSNFVYVTSVSQFVNYIHKEYRIIIILMIYNGLIILLNKRRISSIILWYYYWIHVRCIITTLKYNILSWSPSVYRRSNKNHHFRYLSNLNAIKRFRIICMVHSRITTIVHVLDIFIALTLWDEKYLI